MVSDTLLGSSSIEGLRVTSLAASLEHCVGLGPRPASSLGQRDAASLAGTPIKGERIATRADFRSGQPPLEVPPEPTAAEREVADLIPIEADSDTARVVLDRVPLWFHTFALDPSNKVYTPGIARDHRYRIPALPEHFRDLSVLDIGTFDGFYAFLAEARGAKRVVAVDNEQYREWISSRWGVELEGGEGFAAIRELLDSQVEYRRLDAFDLDELGETFDLILCFGILHRVENPLGLLKILRRRLADGGRVLLETHGPTDRSLDSAAAVEVPEAGEVYAHDDFVYWGFAPGGLDAMARHAGFEGFELIDAPTIDGHQRVIGALISGALD